MTLNKKIIIAAVAIGLIGLILGYPTEQGEPMPLSVARQPTAPLPASPVPTEDYYVCPMHPEIIAHEPGNCPICAMELVKKQGGGAVVHNHGDYPTVQLSSTVVHNLGVRTAKVTLGEMRQHIETLGKITRIDTAAKHILTPPIDGRLVYIADKYEGDEIQQGELLFSVASEALFEQERRYQEAALAGDHATTNTMLAELSRQGIDPEQIAKLEAGGKPEFPAEVHAQEEAYVFARRGAVGETVNTGFTVFNLGGNNRIVEVTAEIFERQWGQVEEDQAARMSVRGLPGTIFEGRVIRVEPPVGYTTRSLEVRLKFKTDHPELSQSMFAHINILGTARKDILMVPSDSVIRTSTGEHVVVLREDGLYQPVSVVAGEDAAGMTEIRSGLGEGTTVVVSGQFLIDSESNLQAEFRRMSATPPHAQDH
ncbi:MAG: efflux RND transporter periplasmic adaptor subunit [Methylovulum sp.]|nr:efflux RND transporter periplasmic adaptor subunit [Methylovulum sp.]